MKREEAAKTLQHCETENYCQHYIETRHCDGCNRREALDMAIEALADRPHGEWIEPQLIYTDAHKVTCTNCGGRVVIVGETNYCPNCGADMRTPTQHGFTADEWYRNTFKGGDSE